MKGTSYYVYSYQNVLKSKYGDVCPHYTINYLQQILTICILTIECKCDIFWSIILVIFSYLSAANIWKLFASAIVYENFAGVIIAMYLPLTWVLFISSGSVVR